MEEKNTFLERIENSAWKEFVVGTRSYSGQMTVEVRANRNYEVLASLKETFGFTYLADITATDHYTDSERFEVIYNLVNMKDKVRLHVSCKVEESDPVLDSVVSIWKAADWFEREAFDMIGVQFRNHPDLRRIYMPEDYAFFPLRKEFPLLGIPGSIELPEKDAPKEYN